jgi:hypothetical protein
MPQPNYVPVPAADRVRPAERLPVPEGWSPTRPAEVVDGGQHVGIRGGSPGPDQGYALKLARHFVDRLVLAPDEHVDDVIMGCLAVALKRASLFGRAPVAADLELAFVLWGFFDGAPADLVSFRKPFFAVAGHHYEDQRAIADVVPESTLRLTPQQVVARLASWWDLLALARR